MNRTKRSLGMAGTTVIVLMVGLLMASGTAFGQFTYPPLTVNMPAGTATVDGDLSEWAGANWIDGDGIYNGDPSDLADVKWACRWAPDALYMAVTGVDTDHRFVSGYTAWNANDGIEYYVDAGNTNQDPYGYPYTAVQHFVGAPDGSGGEWMTFGTGGAVPAGTVPAFASSVVGDVVSYEVKLTPYSNYDVSNPGASTVLTLAKGMTVGLDFDMMTLHGGDYLDPGAVFGAKNNPVHNVWYYQNMWAHANALIDHVLVPEPISIVLLLIGGMCMAAGVRRRRF